MPVQLLMFVIAVIYIYINIAMVSLVSVNLFAMLTILEWASENPGYFLQIHGSFLLHLFSS